MVQSQVSWLAGTAGGRGLFEDLHAESFVLTLALGVR